MTTQYSARPSADEHTPYYGRYIALVPDGDLVAMLARQAEETAALLAPLLSRAGAASARAGEWNTIEIVGHLADTERVLVYRALRIARADPKPLEGVDDFAPYVPMAGFRPAIARGRRGGIRGGATSEPVALPKLRSRSMGTVGIADGSPVSVRALGYIVAGHDCTISRISSDTTI